MMQIGAVITLVSLTVNLHYAASEVTSLRWCTTSRQEMLKCMDMQEAFARHSVGSLTCVNATSVQECLTLINSDQADLITLDGGDIYEAGRNFNMVPIMQEFYGSGTGSNGYYAIAVVRKSSPEFNIRNLRGRKSCHTGVRKTAGWNVPVGFLLQHSFMTVTGCGDDIRAAGNFFSKSCAPGALSPPYNPRGDNPASLCALCQTDGCPRNSQEPYYNYAGAFRCLAEGAGDVAFIKPEVLEAYTDGNSQEDWAASLKSGDFELLCADGTRAPVGSYETCHLAFVPSHAVMTSKAHDVGTLQNFRSVLNDAQLHFGLDGPNRLEFSMFESTKYGGKSLLFKDSTVSLQDVVDQDYMEYLGAEYLATIKGLQRCPVNPLRWCVTSDQEEDKCRDMSAAFSNAGLSPALSCHRSQSADHCAEDIKNDRADLVSLDGGELLQNGRLHGVAPIMAEDYGYGDASYWAVAVVNRSSTFNINNLRGKKSCHTGYMRTAGFISPVGFLINKGYITVNQTSCQVAEAVGDFFNKSCIPGALEPRNNPDGNNPDSLCALCKGLGGNKCKPTAAEPYVGYSGAFRCLAEGAGDVAFVKHTTVGINTDGAGYEPWTYGLRKSDFQLLCPDGHKAEVDDYLNCSLAKVPAHTVVTAGWKTAAQRQVMVNLLSEGQTHFKEDSTTGFKMFDSSDYPQSRDLLFKDSTVQLISVGDKNSYDTFLDRAYLENAEAVTCQRSP